MKSAKFILLNILFILVLGINGFSATLHAVFVINTEDKGIGCEYDLKNWETILPEIKKYSGLKVVTYYLKDKNWSETAVNKKIAQIKPVEDDVILFYYSGHGFRFTQGQGDQWPFLALQEGVKSLHAIYSEFYKKNPRLLIVISDSCNSFCPGTPPKVQSRGVTQETLIAENYKNLFLKSKGAIIASGCIPGQYSFGGAPDGGAYTSTLLKNIKLAVRGENASWKQIFETSNQPLVGGKQQPQYKLDYDPFKTEGNSEIASDQNGEQSNDGTISLNNQNKEDIENENEASAGGDVDFDELEDADWCSQALDIRNLFNNALILVESSKYLPDDSDEYANLLEYAEAQEAYFTNDEPDKTSAKYWNGIVKLIKTSTNKKAGKQKIKQLTTFLKQAQQEMLKIINEQACKRKE